MALAAPKRAQVTTRNDDPPHSISSPLITRGEGRLGGDTIQRFHSDQHGA